MSADAMIQHATNRFAASMTIRLIGLDDLEEQRRSQPLFYAQFNVSRRSLLGRRSEVIV